MLNVAQILSGATTAGPQRIALRFGDLAMPVSVLDNLAKQCARLFSGEGVGRGHRIAMVMPNVPHFPVVYYGGLRTGATVVPLSSRTIGAFGGSRSGCARIETMRSFSASTPSA